MNNLEAIANAIVADGKGVLAADETPGTLTKRFIAREIESTADSRRAYRELFLTTPGIEAFIGGVILQDETINQKSSKGPSLGALAASRGVIPGIKVDESTHPLAGAPGELITEGLDGLRGRLKEYYELGARFAKWRAVITIADGIPTARCVRANAHALARYAALCQEQGLVPIVEPEVLMSGSHTLVRCEDVTGFVLETVFDQLFEANVSFEGLLLKPNMVTAGQDCARQATVDEVAEATLRTLTRHVPPAVPGIVFLSGGQSSVLATSHLDAINRLQRPKPWKLSFSFGRALQNEALEAWDGHKENVPAAQRAFHHRAQCVSAAARGQYGIGLESEPGFRDVTATQLQQH